MKFLFTLLLLVLSTTLSARIGDTVDVLNKRYGDVTFLVIKGTPELPPTRVYKTREWPVSASIFKGKCVSIVYRRVDASDLGRFTSQRLLRLNLPKIDLQNKVADANGEHYMSKDGRYNVSFLKKNFVIQDWTSMLLYKKDQAERSTRGL